MLRAVRSICWYLFRRRDMEAGLDAELQYHLDRQTDQNLSRGMNRFEARRAAMISLGEVAALKDDCRDSRRGRTVEITMQDIRYGFRVLMKNPGFAAMAILTMALGIGANTAIFSLVYGVLLRPLPYENGPNLVVLHPRIKARAVDISLSVPELNDFRNNSKTLDAVVEHHTMVFLLLANNTAERVQSAVVSANFFNVLGVKPLLGRTFVPDDDTPNSNAVLILSYKYWKSNQGGDPNIVGKVFQMNNRPHTVIGVLPPVPQYPGESDVYMPTSQCPTRASAQFQANRRGRMMNAFGRMKPGVTVQQARADLSVATAQMASAHPDVYTSALGYSMKTEGLRDDLVRSARATFLVLLGASGLVLLIACANVGNLLLARAVRMEREMAVRSALGASRSRLLRQSVTESMLVSVLGGLLGLALAPLTLSLLVKFAERFTTRAAEVQIDGPVLAFTLLVSLGTGLLFGLLPVTGLREKLGEALRQGGTRTTGSRQKQRMRSALVVAQVAVSFVVLVAAGLMIRSYLELKKVDPGFDTSRLLTARVSPNFTKYNTRQLQLQLYQDLGRKIRSIPGVEDASLASNTPFSPSGIASGPNALSFELEGRPISADETAPRINFVYTDAGYFSTIRQPLAKGRVFTDRDDAQAPPVAVINQTMARQRWNGEDPLGRRVTFDGRKTWVEIVGIVGDAKEFGLEKPSEGEIYLSMAQSGFGNKLVLRTTADPIGMTAVLRKTIHEFDPQMALDEVGTVERMEYESQASPRVTTILLGLFGVLATIICGSGIAAAIALSVSQRTHELGIRMALGAAQAGVVRLVVREGLVLAITGTVIGLAGSVLLARAEASLLFAISSTDLATFVAVPVVFLMVAAIAAFIPARRVTSIDPLIALRQE
jgi:predicted permease